jgi:hypothetical protein
MPPANLPPEQTWQVVAYVRSLTAPRIDNKAPGDAKAGEDLFGAKAAAADSSHQGRGGSLGPDLPKLPRCGPSADSRPVLDPVAEVATVSNMSP